MGEAVRIGHGSPGIVVVEAVETTNVSTREGDTLFSRVELDRRDEATAASGVDILPIASRPDGCRCRQDESGASHLEGSCNLVWSLESVKSV